MFEDEDENEDEDEGGSVRMRRLRGAQLDTETSAKRGFFKKSRMGKGKYMARWQFGLR